jgi:glycosyltransferase 2 family protein
MRPVKRWRFWIGLVISAVFLWWALKGLALADLLRVLPGLDYWWLVPAIAVYFVGVWVRTWRWHYLLRPIKVISTAALFPIVTIGYAANNIFPARAGEVLRAIVLKRHEGVAISASLATIIVERVYDGVVMLAFVFVNLTELTKLTGASGFVGDIRTLAIVGTMAFLGALLVFLLAAMFPERALTIVNVVSQRLVPKRYREMVLDLTGKFLGGLAALRSPRDALMVFLTSVVIWLLETVKYWLLMHAFPFQVTFFTLMLMNGISNLVTTIPSAPGYIGTFDASGIAVLTAFGVERSLAAVYTLVLHAALWLPITLLGLYYMAREGISWGTDLDKARAEA